MMRLIGILTGSALAVAVLILAVGLPKFQPAETQQAVVADDIATAAPPAVEQVAAAPAPEPLVEAPTEPLTEVPTEQVAEAMTEPLAEAVVEPPAEPAREMPVMQDSPVTSEEQGWYAFWSPFRSRIAADGFVAELQRTTGLDYRVVKVKTGIYEVAFAYTDDADIEDKLARIADATGMDMSGG